MKKMHAVVAWLMVLVLVCGSVAVADVCTHSNKYLLSERFMYVEDVEGHYVHTLSSWKCPDCGSILSDVTAKTYQGHVWVLQYDEHLSGHIHRGWYECEPCGREKTVDFICDGPPCQTIIYRLVPEQEVK